MSDPGLEESQKLGRKLSIVGDGGSKSGSNRPSLPTKPNSDELADPGLREVAEVWHKLPPALKAGILAMVRTAGNNG